MTIHFDNGDTWEVLLDGRVETHPVPRLINIAFVDVLEGEHVDYYDERGDLQTTKARIKWLEP